MLNRDQGKCRIDITSLSIFCFFRSASDRVSPLCFSWCRSVSTSSSFQHDVIVSQHDQRQYQNTRMDRRAATVSAPHLFGDCKTSLEMLTNLWSFSGSRMAGFMISRTPLWILVYMPADASPKRLIVFWVLSRRKCESTIFYLCQAPLPELDKSTRNVLLSTPEIIMTCHQKTFRIFIFAILR